jgi:hypothetical protein
VLARFQNALGDGVMRVRYREVDHDIQRGVGKQVIHALRLNVELGRAGRGGFHVDIRHSAHFQPFEQGRKFQIRGRDVAAADDTDA